MAQTILIIVIALSVIIFMGAKNYAMYRGIKVLKEDFDIESKCSLAWFDKLQAYERMFRGHRTDRVSVVGHGCSDSGFRYNDFRPSYCVVITNTSESGDEQFQYILKSFEYDPEDPADRDYAKLCAEELQEVVECDWRIKGEKE